MNLCAFATLRDLFLSLSVVFIFAERIFAQLPTAQLTSVFPPGGPRGATVELTIAGSDSSAAMRSAYFAVLSAERDPFSDFMTVFSAATTSFSSCSSA